MKGARGHNGESCRVLLRRSFLAALIVVLGVPVGAARADHAATLHCSGDELRAVPTSIAGATGFYATPPGQPVGLVVFFHGYGHTAADWAEHHLQRVARANHVITLAMDYPGADTTHTWQVAEGARASNLVAAALVGQCPRLDTVVAYGVSMGGNASGLALAELAENPGLYDWWFDIEGANNVTETYNEARLLAPANAFAAEAVRGIELEMGTESEDDRKTFEQDPQAYLDHTNVYRVDDIIASGIRGVVMVHAVDDGLVPYNQSREMQAAIGGRVPVQFWTVLSAGRVDGQNGSERKGDTTIEGYATENVDGAPSPLAGHSNELNEDSRVAWVGFDRLDALFQRGVVPRSETAGDYLYDEETGTYEQP